MRETETDDWEVKGFFRKVISSMKRQQGPHSLVRSLWRVETPVAEADGKQGHARVRARIAEVARVRARMPEVGDSGFCSYNFLRMEAVSRPRACSQAPLICGQETKKGAGRWGGGDEWMEPIFSLMLTNSSGKKSWHLMPFSDCEPRPEQRSDSGIALLLGINL